MTHVSLKWLIACMLFCILAAPISLSAAEPNDAKEQAARRNLMLLAHSLDRYMRYNENKAPARISEIYEQGFALDLDLFIRPGSENRIASAKEIDEKTDYVLAPKQAGKGPYLLLKEKKSFQDGKALAYYSDRTIRKEAPGLPEPAVVEVESGLRVPALVGRTSAEADKALRTLGLIPKFELGSAAPTKDLALKVVRTTPAANMLIAKGSEVAVMLYGPTEQRTDGLIAVPSLSGLSAAKARQALEEAGLKGNFQLGQPALVKDKALTVFLSDPAAGALVAKGVEVKVTLYSPHDGKTPDPPEFKTVSVPDCLTLSLDEATAKLKAAGFAVTSKMGRSASFTAQLERVYQMEPAPGTSVRPGETIQLLIYGNLK